MGASFSLEGNSLPWTLLCWSQSDSKEKMMYKLAVAILLLSAPAFAQNKSADPAALQSCPPTGQTARGELIYSLDCKAITTDYTVGENKPNMPPTNLKNTVIPKSGDVQTPATTPTTAAETK
jgi:hypothetical protein